MIKNIFLLTLLCSNLGIAMSNPLNALKEIGLSTETKKTVDQLREELAIAIKELSGAVVDSTAHLSQAVNGTSLNMTKALVGTSANLEKTITISTTEVCKAVTQATQQITSTANKLIDAGVPALNQNINALMQHGVPARIVIDPATIKTLCFSTTGAALAMSGIGLILYESFFAENYITETPKSTSWSMTVKNFMKSRYVLGSASIAAGLCLIAKSASL